MKIKTILLCCLDFANLAIYSQTGQISEKAMVVSAREEASKIGVEIMKKGGNAFDAMIATSFALAVCYPEAGNIAGGGFMVYRKNTGETGALDYRETAPLAAHKDMYLDNNGNVIPDKSTATALASGIPGTIACLFEVHRKFGNLPMNVIMEPVIALAQKGVIVTEKQAMKLDKFRPLFIKANGNNSLFSKEYKVNDTIKYHALASTLKRISDNGEAEFYSGNTAKIYVDFITQKGGNITLKDLKKYKAKWREPISFRYKELEIISMSPPSSGGICLNQIMKMLEPYDLSLYKRNSLEYIQLLTETERRAYADRNFYLGDPDFVKIPVEKLTDSLYLKNRMNDFSFNKATKSSDIAEGKPHYESTETTHFSIIDAEGNAVSVTTTINDNFGSKIYCDELGFFLNNEMDDFSAKPGEPNLYGLTGSEANSIAPQKRMLSSMTPTIVEKNDKLYMVLGTPGGSTIITTVLQSILNVYEYKMSMQEAVNAPRFHHQWLPDVITFEPNSFSPTTIENLKAKGYKVEEKENTIIGVVNAILFLPNGNKEGASDKRSDSKSVGY